MRLRQIQRKVFAIIGLALVLAAGNCAAAPSPDPLAQIKQGISEVLAVFQDPQMPLSQRREKLRQLAETYFDFDAMARSALGYHWRALDDQQRAEFTTVFTTFIQDAYLSKLENSTVAKIRQEAQAATVTFDGETFDDTDYAQVNSKVGVPEQRDPLQVNYLMHRSAEQWRIYDITINAISIIGNYRNQFNRIINNDGFAKLVAELRQKTAQLQQSIDAGPRAAKPAQ